MLRSLIFLLSAFTAAMCSYQSMSERVSNQLVEQGQESEVLYLPNGEGLQFLSFGYKNMLSDALWFKTISYFGKHFKTDRDYRWLAHMCGLVTELDANAHHVYKFCSTMLAWEAGLPEESVKVLTKATENHPGNWMYYYLRGFSYFFFLNDEEKAREDFVVSAKLPDAPLLVKRLAAKNVAMSDPSTAVAFLEDMLKKAEDGSARQALEDRLREAIYERDARQIERGLELYKERFGKAAQHLDELKSAEIVGQGPLRDPFGGTYVLDEKTGRVLSSTGKQRLELFRKEEQELKEENNTEGGTHVSA